MKRITRKRLLWGLLLAAAVLTVWTVWGNRTVQTSVFHIHDPKLPRGFDGYRIAQISDLHNAEFGKGNSTLLSILRKEAPDIIVFTGDFIDSRRTDLDVSAAFAEEAVKIAPCYYVTGNHEARLPWRYEELERRLLACGVTVLHDRTQLLTAPNGDTVRLIGVDDPNYAGRADGIHGPSDQVIHAALEAAGAGAGAGYQILLSHRPELFDTYVAHHIDLAFCGHAHGGQFRLPLIGGLVAPNQGLFPQYDAGLFHRDGTTMTVSRGVGNSIIPVRFNDRPEVLVAELHSDRA